MKTYTKAEEEKPSNKKCPSYTGVSNYIFWLKELRAEEQKNECSFKRGRIWS